MHTVIILALSLAASLSPAIGTANMDAQAEALRQEVVNALRLTGPLKASIRLTRHAWYSTAAPVLPDCQETGQSSLEETESKAKLQVSSEGAGMASRFSPIPKRHNDFTGNADLLAYICDPFIAHFQTGFPKPNDPIIYVRNVHYVGEESRNYVQYRVLQIDQAIVTAPTTPQREARATVVVTNWKWYVGPNHLICRMTWDDHEGEMQNPKRENEMLVESPPK